ncbi:VOC family protein [Chthonobacter rhizosphaerae]|uniref:VOC family protein n=1 Tax=Chthonobacter rhizosphaerae TaxID=2735553 RepID=UPI0015EE815B|nr:VOC family protein [Chthonobacter rhizosphaerae]
MMVQPYLFFDGRTDEAARFYQTALGAEIVERLTFGDAPEPPPPGMLPPGSEGKVMHMTLKIGDSLVMVSDGHCGGNAAFQGFSLTITLPDPAAVDRVADRLADGGQITMPLGETFFARRFGMLTDRFGVAWILIAPR